MPFSEEDFELWCWRNGGETYVEPPVGPGIVCRFPNADTPDTVADLPDADGFQVHTQGQFYSTLSIHQHTDARIDADDRLHIETADAHLIVEPRSSEVQ